MSATITVVMHISPGYNGLIRAPAFMQLRIELLECALIAANSPCEVRWNYHDADPTGRPMGRKDWSAACDLNKDEIRRPVVSQTSPFRSIEFSILPLQQEPLAEEAQIAQGRSPLTIARVRVDYSVEKNEKNA